jgi:subtilisin family serine protease
MSEAYKAGVSPNAIYCSQGLRDRNAESADIPFRVAPRYQGLWFEEAKPLSRKETDDHMAGLQKVARPKSSRRGAVNIGVIDTGIAQGPFLNTFLEDVVPPHYLVAAASADPPDPDGNGTVESPAGHGTFVTGVIAQAKERVRVHVVRAVGRQGAVSDLQLAEAIDELVRTLRREAIELDILNLSLGGWTYDDRRPLLTGDRIDRLPGSTLVVAAAGNMESQRRFWPAAMERVVGVGAVVKDGPAYSRAEYSNYGGWIDAVAHDGGVHVPGGRSTGAQTSTFYTAFPPGHRAKYTGWAKWRGTSFTTPHVAARIAQRMLADNLRTAQEAWERIRRDADAAPPDFPNAVRVD